VLNEEVWEIQMGHRVGDTRLGAVADIRLPVTATKQNMGHKTSIQCTKTIGHKTSSRHQQNIGHKTSSRHQQNIGHKTPTRHQQNIGHKTPVQLFLKLSGISHHHHQHTIRCKPGPQLLPQKTLRKPSILVHPTATIQPTNQFLQPSRLHTRSAVVWLFSKNISPLWPTTHIHVHFSPFCRVKKKDRHYTAIFA
jgi:hypothetical protein